MNLLLSDFSPVLVYHAVYENVPQDIRENLHNVSPDVIYEHLSYLKKHYRLVSVDELASLSKTKGVAAITFDDGYKCVIDNIYDLLITMDIPFTVFVNSASMENRIFWRDKVRYVINNNMVAECESFFEYTRPVEHLPFYRYTKHPSNNSRIVDEELDRFLSYKNISLHLSNYCFDDVGYFKSHRLSAYGNHTHNHYVLSSLSQEEQYEEIERTRQFLKSLPDIQVSEVFSIPFGQTRDFNDDTLRILQDLGYRSALLSRQRLNAGLRRNGGITMIERLMAKPGSLPLSLARLHCAYASKGQASEG
jgi:peptidoglycan/xylan/chitin deacetylase (PgdA/CDA1 family)